MTVSTGVGGIPVIAALVGPEVIHQVNQPSVIKTAGGVPVARTNQPVPVAVFHSLVHQLAFTGASGLVTLLALAAVLLAAGLLVLGFARRFRGGGSSPTGVG